MNGNVLEVENLGKSYPLPRGVLRVFDGLLGALDRPTAGRVVLDGEDLFSRTEREIAAVRGRKIGFVFQFYHLLPEFTALENVSFPLMIQGLGRAEAFARARELLRDVSLEEKAQSRPGQLSGGEQQRVAIARALVSEPPLLLADEPTGNLDWKSGEMVLRLILELHERRGLSSIIVTHNEKIARYCHKLYLMEAGELKLLAAPPSY